MSVMARTPVGIVNDTPLTAPGAATGANTNDSAAMVLLLWTMQAPEAPSPPADGNVTASAKYMATAASTALPPFTRISRPTSAARLSSAETAAKEEPRKTLDRPPLPAALPAGLEALSACSELLSVSLLPQADSRRVPTSAKLRN
ncbi:MAG: hypothetical protein EBY18_09570 [Alphaproteobacteria bacterium]|nr:hypothetical protein [Alphaproteobacteria bacterium]